MSFLFAPRLRPADSVPDSSPSRNVASDLKLGFEISECLGSFARGAVYRRFGGHYFNSVHFIGVGRPVKLMI